MVAGRSAVAFESYPRRTGVGSDGHCPKRKSQTERYRGLLITHQSSELGFVRQRQTWWDRLLPNHCRVDASSRRISRERRGQSDEPLDNLIQDRSGMVVMRAHMFLSLAYHFLNPLQKLAVFLAVL